MNGQNVIKSFVVALLLSFWGNVAFTTMNNLDIHLPIYSTNISLSSYYARGSIVDILNKIENKVSSSESWLSRQGKSEIYEKEHKACEITRFLICTINEITDIDMKEYKR